jgi:hypothetical protein
MYAMWGLDEVGCTKGKRLSMRAWGLPVQPVCSVVKLGACVPCVGWMKWVDTTQGFLSWM